MKLPLPITLASKSPRRHELMQLMQLPFTVELLDADESYPPGMKPEAIAMYIAEKKAAAFGPGEGKLVLTADTIVAVEGEILGKPANRDEARDMLRKLAARTHEVFTGVSIGWAGALHTFFDRSEVTCREVSDAEINFYIDHFQPFDKAGAYGIQDWWGLTVVTAIKGSYTNIMGLPTQQVFARLADLFPASADAAT